MLAPTSNLSWSQWTDFMKPAQTEYFRRILFAAEPISKLKDPDDDNRLMRVVPHQTITPVEFEDIGGNLSVFLPW